MCNFKDSASTKYNLTNLAHAEKTSNPPQGPDQLTGLLLSDHMGEVCVLLLDEVGIESDISLVFRKGIATGNATSRI